MPGRMIAVPREFLCTLPQHVSLGGDEEVPIVFFFFWRSANVFEHAFVPPRNRWVRG